jgi:CDP-L-myo-inositol myo-inositolphosphotransferase
MAEIIDREIPEGREGTVPHPDAHARPRLAVVLAAGRSERLSGVTAGRSKAVLRVAGQSLVERAVRALLTAGLERVVVVVGYEAGPVAAVVNRIAPGRVRAVYAERWADGNGASLSAAERAVEGEPLFVVVTADHVFSEGALAPLIAAGTGAVLVDHAPHPDAWLEGTRVRMDAERVVAFSKKLDDPSIDCGAFLLPTAVFEAQRRAEARGDASLAAAVTDLAATHPLAAIELPRGAWWQDVDTPADLRRAARLLRRSLTKDTDGPVSRYLNRPISTRISFSLSHLPIHPDVVSVLATVVAIAGAMALARGSGILAAVLVHLTSVLDGVDGELARLQVRASPAGALLDGVLDRLGDAAILAGTAVWAISGGESPGLVVVAAVAATTGSMLSMATKDRIAALGIPPAPERAIGWLFGGRDARLLIVAVCALARAPLVALIVVSATSVLSLGVRLLLTSAAIRSGWRGAR